MKPRIKVGDRVSCYEAMERVTGEVISIVSADCIEVKTNDESILCFHYKQCRKLVKKQRSKIWVDPKYLEGNRSISFSREPMDSWVEFVEVKKE